MRLLASLLLLIASLASTSPVARAVEVNESQAMVLDGVIQGPSLGVISAAIDGKKSGDTVDLVIDSPGGSVFAGFQFISTMLAAKGRGVTIRCFVPHVAASMAFQILLHCDQRYALNHSFLLWHRARIMFGGLFGQAMTSPQLYVAARDLARTDAVILNGLTKALKGMSESDVQYHFENETLHVGNQLALEVPQFITSLDYIPNLIEVLGNDNLPRSRRMFIFGLEEMFKRGEQIYIRECGLTPCSYAEQEAQ